MKITYEDFCNILNLLFNLYKKKKSQNTFLFSLFYRRIKMFIFHLRIFLAISPNKYRTKCELNNVNHNDNHILHTKNPREAWNIRRYRWQRNVPLALCSGTLERKRWEAAWKQLDAVRDKWRQSDAFLNYNWGPYGCNRFALL